MNHIHLHIKELLSEHDCVIIPNFGAFIADYCPANIDKEEGSIPSKDILFNRSLTRNDGLLINALIEQDGQDYKKAKEEIETFVGRTMQQLTRGESIVFEGIGTLKQDEVGYLFFEAEKNNELLRDAYGLKPISLDKINSEAPVKAQAKTQETATIREAIASATETKATEKNRHVPSQKRKILLRTAASIAAVIILVILATPISDSSKIEQSSLAPSIDITMGPEHKSALTTPTNATTTKVTSLPLSRCIQNNGRLETEEHNENAITIITPKTDVIPDIIETVTAKPNTPINRDFHVIVASLTSHAKAVGYASRFKAEYDADNIQILKSDTRYRISVANFTNEMEAKEFINTLRLFNPKLHDAWILKNK